MRNVGDLHESLNDHRRFSITLILPESNGSQIAARHNPSPVSFRVIIVILEGKIPLSSASHDDFAVRNIGGHDGVYQDLTKSLALDVGLVQMRSQPLVPGVHE
jgi:hypothetical protein